MNREDIIRMARQVEAEGFAPVGVWPEVRRLCELAYAAGAAAEREACAKVCEEKQEHLMPIPCPDGISGCLVAHYVPARREKTGNECAAAIRARGQA